MITYPIFYNIYHTLDNDERYDYDTRLFINIIISKYYKMINNINSLNNTIEINHIKNQLSNQINKLSFDNPYYKDLFISLNDLDLDHYNDISKDLIFSYINSKDFFTNDSIYDIKKFIFNILDIIYNDNINEDKYINLLKFYPNTDRIIYSFSYIHIDDFSSLHISSLFNDILDNITTVEKLVELLSSFYIESKPSFYYKSFSTFSIFNLGRIYDINKNLNNLYIDNISDINIIKNKIFYLDNTNREYSDFSNFLQSYLKNDISSAENINNNMNSWKMFNDIFLISLEEDNNDDNIDDNDINNVDDDNIDDNDTNDDDTNDDDINNTDNSDDNTNDDNIDDNIDDNKKSYKQYIKYKLNLVSDEESLEDFLYKIALYKKIYNYVYNKNITVNVKKIEILKKWISKWIFLTSLSETTTLIKQLKLKNF